MGPDAPPYDEEAEAACVGAMLLDEPALYNVLGLLKESDFWILRNRHIFRAARNVAYRGETPDLVLVQAELKRLQIFEEVGGPHGLGEVMSKCPSPSNVEAYCNQVLERSRLRRLQIAVKGIAADIIATAKHEGSAIIERAENLIFDIGEDRMKDLVQRVGDAWEPEFNRLKDLAAHGKQPGIQTGFDGYDKLTGGFHPGQLVILAARPSVGKSAWGLNVAMNLAKQKVPVALFSLEMTREELRARIVSSEASVDSMLLRTGTPSPGTLETYQRVMQSMQGLPFYMNDDSHMHLTRLVSSMRLLVRKMGVKVVVVDYLQLLTIANFKGKRYEEVTKISATLMRETKKLGITTVALAQVNREAVSGGKKDRVQVWHLRESGTIEQDAHVIALMQPDEGNPTMVCVYVDKNRGGPKGDFWLDFHAPFLRFVDQRPRPREE